MADEPGDHREPAMVEFTDPRLVAIYDTVNQYGPGEQPDFYAGLAAEIGARSIVDLGCGTGMVTCELARLGYQMIGVDPAPAMLEIARHREFGDRVQWIDGGADALRHPGADLAIMSGHIAQFFITDERWHEALVNLHRALRPGGLLAFESRNPDAREWERWTPQESFTVHDPAAGRVDIWYGFDDLRDGIVSYTNHYVFAATGEELAAPNQLRFRSQAELTESLGDAGFEIERVFGDWDRRPASTTTRELVVVAHR